MDEILALAFLTFRSHKLRSLLTALGIIIGVTTVIAILSLIEGFNQTIIGQLRTLGSEQISLTKSPITYTTGNLNIEEIAKLPDLTPEDAFAIAKLASVKRAVPLIQKQISKIKYQGKEILRIIVIGTTHEYFYAENHAVEFGHAFSEEDVDHRRAVCVIGSSINDAIFGEELGMGAELRIEGHRVKILGVLKKSGSFLGQNLDDVIVLPYTYYEKIFSHNREKSLIEQAFYTYSINIEPKRGMLKKALDDVEEIMRRRRGLRSDQPNNFGLTTPEMLYDVYKKITKAGFIALIAIGAISLIVGGVGIMNIMLVSVAERTREIGIRKAVGASNQLILLQFLSESVILSLIGGVLGIILGIMVAWFISLVSLLKAAVSLWMVLLGFGFSSAIGIFFGIYPARKAAILNPIEALRYE